MDETRNFTKTPCENRSGCQTRDAARQSDALPHNHYGPPDDPLEAIVKLNAGSRGLCTGENTAASGAPTARNRESTDSSGCSTYVGERTRDSVRCGFDDAGITVSKHVMVLGALGCDEKARRGASKDSRSMSARPHLP